jgi:hypothetical protein
MISEATTADRVDVRADCQGRLDKIEYLIGIYRMRYVNYVGCNHEPEAGEMERKIDRLLERWQRVHDRELVATMS